MTLDVLAIGAHPDDADLGVGGTLHKLADAGYACGILDLTQGELATRGTPEIRAAEAAEAARRLGLARREQAALPDGGLADTLEQRAVVAHWIRVLRPRLILAPMAPDRHPDHEAAHHLARSAHFFSGVAGLDTGAAPHRADRILYYHAYHEADLAPAVVVDIGGHFEAKRHALAAYASQFHQPDAAGPQTHVSSRAFWDNIETRARHWGARIGASHGEPLHHEGPLPLDLPPGFGGMQS